MQACGTDVSRPGPNAAALSFLLPRLLGSGCEGSVSEALYSRARTLERELFDRDQLVELSEQFPAAVPVRRGGAAVTPQALATR